MSGDRPEWCRRQGFAPNRFFGSVDDDQVVYLVAVRSPRYGGIALNQASLDSLKSRPLTGFVVLAEADLSPASVVPVREVAERLASEPPLSGRLGVYWWINGTGGATNGSGWYSPSGSGNGGSYLAPF